MFFFTAGTQEGRPLKALLYYALFHWRVLLFLVFFTFARVFAHVFARDIDTNMIKTRGKTREN